METRVFDVAVVGGAFSGSATALLLKRDHPDLRIALIDRKTTFDRKVGESSIELAAWFMTRKLGLDRHLATEHLPKYGQRYWFQNEHVHTLADASELGNFYQSLLPSYHVDRAVLDEHVHALAARQGVEILRPARVVDVELRPGAPSRLTVEEGGAKETIEARWVVDATGRQAWLARRSGHFEPMPEHPIRSIWARYKNVRDFDGDWLASRDASRGAGPSGPCGVACARSLSTNHLTGLGYWVWVIPLPGGDVSVGVVWDERLLTLPDAGSLAEQFEAFMTSFPAGRELLEGATRVEGDLHALKALPYRVNKVADDGWLAVGDAAGFIDPFYSPGLDWAALTVTKSVNLIGRSLRGGLTGPALQTAVGAHNREFTRGFSRWFEAIYRDKYYVIGDAELMEIALRTEVSLYYLGILTGPYRRGETGLDVPFSHPLSIPFYKLMSFITRRLASIGRARVAAGTWGRANAGRHVFLPGFRLGPRMLKFLPGALARLARAEILAIPDRLRANARASTVTAPVSKRLDDDQGLPRPDLLPVGGQHLDDHRFVGKPHAGVGDRIEGLHHLD
jgi:flavin-dependent dehydrogenase